MLLAVAPDIQWLNAHQQQRCDHREVANSIDQETPAFAESSNHYSRNRWSDEPRAICHRRIDRDRVAQVAPVFDHLHQKRLPPRHVEGIDQSLKGGESNDLPQVDHVRQRKRGQRQ